MALSLVSYAIEYQLMINEPNGIEPELASRRVIFEDRYCLNPSCWTPAQIALRDLAQTAQRRANQNIVGRIAMRRICLYVVRVAVTNVAIEPLHHFLGMMVVAE